MAECIFMYIPHTWSEDYFFTGKIIHIFICKLFCYLSVFLRLYTVIQHVSVCLHPWHLLECSKSLLVPVCGYFVIDVAALWCIHTHLWATFKTWQHSYFVKLALENNMAHISLSLSLSINVLWVVGTSKWTSHSSTEVVWSRPVNTKQVAGSYTVETDDLVWA